MLRLRVAESLPWVDSRGQVRSPFEEFQLLDGDAKAALDSGRIGEFQAWEFGVLTDDWDAPESSKPQLVGIEDGEGVPIRCFAVGGEDAPDLYRTLAPLWVEFLEWLIGSSSERVLLSDELWHPKGDWVEFGPALKEGLIPPCSFDLTPVGRAGLYTARVDFAQLRSLLRTWWPSGLGSLAGVSLDPTAGHEVDERIASTGKLKLEDLPQLTHYVETSRAFDNLGFAVLSRKQPWDKLRSRLADRGWTDGKPLELITSAAG